MGVLYIAILLLYCCTGVQRHMQLVSVSLDFFPPVYPRTNRHEVNKGNLSVSEESPDGCSTFHYQPKELPQHATSKNRPTPNELPFPTPTQDSIPPSVSLQLAGHALDIATPSLTAPPTDMETILPHSEYIW